MEEFQRYPLHLRSDHPSGLLIGGGARDQRRLAGSFLIKDFLLELFNKVKISYVKHVHKKYYY